ncbi:MAG: hypothetical protein ABIL70_07415 [candidate division WOR-3 bacterium]
MATAINNTGTTSDTVRIYVTVNPYYDLDIADNEQSLFGNKLRLAAPMGDSTQVGYFRVINPNTAELNVDPDIYGNADFDSIKVQVSNLNYVPVPGSDISYVIPAGNVHIVPIPGLLSGESFDAYVRVYVPFDVYAGTYRGTVTVTGYPTTPGTTTDEFTLEVVVGAVDDIDITEASVSATGGMFSTVSLPPFTVWSTDAANNPDAYDGPGNTTLYGVNFTATDLYGPYSAIVIPASNISFEPYLIDSIAPGTSVSVIAKVYIPHGIYAGTYSGLVTASNNSGTTSDTIRINVTVTPIYDLDIADNQANLFANTMHLAGPMGETRSGSFKMVNPANDGQNVDPDLYGNADFTGFTATVDTLWYIPGGAEDINYFIPPSAVSFILPTGLDWGEVFNATVTVNIPYNTYSGVYRGLVTVTGTPGSPGSPTDRFILEVSVGPLDDIDIAEASVSATTDHGTSVWTAPFTVWSTDDDDPSHNPDAYDGPGNTTLYGITFLAQDLRAGDLIIPAANIEFSPSTIDSLAPGHSVEVRARVNVPYGTYATTYSGLATAINNTGTTSDTVRIYVTVNPYYDLDIADNEQSLFGNKMRLAGPMASPTQTGYFRMINPNTSALNVDPDQYGNADFTGFDLYVSDLNYVPVPGSDISYVIPSSAVVVTLPTGLLSGESYNASVVVNIPPDVYAGTYRGIVRVTGLPGIPGTPTDEFTLEVVVGAVDDIDITEASVSGTGNHGTTVNTGYFTVWSTDAAHNPDTYDGPGNTTLYGITFIAQDLRAGDLVIPAANVSFEPITIESLPPGQSREVRALVNVPYGTYATTYSGLAMAINNTGTTSDTVRIYITVLPSYDLDISDNTGNLIENQMRLTVTPLPGVSYDSAYFVLINPNNPDLNVDPDPFGNYDLANIYWSIGDLNHITDPLAYIPKESVDVYMTTPHFLASGGSEDIVVKVNVPEFQVAGEYKSWLIVYDEDADVADSFELKVIVNPLEDIDIIENQIVNTVNTGDTLVYIGEFTVLNQDKEQWLSGYGDPDFPSNIDLNNLRFTCENLREIGPTGRFIPAENVFVEVVGSSAGPSPYGTANISELALGQTQNIKIWALIPRGTYATSYRGEMRVIDDDGIPSDVIAIQINVNAYYDLDIADNEQSLFGNKMRLAGPMASPTQTGYFRMINPNTSALNVDPDVYGNADFTGFNLYVSNLNYVPVPGSDISYVIPSSAVVVTLPTGLLSGESYNASVVVNIPPDVYAGTYRGIVRVTGLPGIPGTPTDEFVLEVVVGAVDDIDITEASVSGTGNHGTTVNTGYFTVWSTDAAHNPDAYDGPGNTTLYGITFTSQDLRFGNFVIPGANVSFEPVTIESLPPGQSRQVRALVNVPYGVHNGTYSGLAMAINNTGTTSDTVRIYVTVNPYYDLDIADNQQSLIENKMTLSGPMGAIRQGTFRMVNPNTPELNVDPDQFGNADFTGFTYSVDTLKYIPFGNEEILYRIPPSAVSVSLPSGLVSGASYDAQVTVNIPMNTFAGVYRGKIRVTGTPTLNTPTDSFWLEVVIGPYDDIDIDSAAVHATTNQGTTVNTTSFRVYSTDAAVNPDPDGPGNTTLYGVTFSCTDLRNGNLYIPAENVQFVPTIIDSIRPAESYAVYARVNVPYGTYATTYSGIATATNNTGTTSDTVRIYVTVNPYYDLDIADNQQNLIGNKLILSGPMGAVRQGRFRIINPNSAELNVDPDQYGNADFTSLSAVVETLKYMPFGNEDILYYIPPSAVTISLPSGLASGAFFDANATVNIPMNTFSGTYRGKVRITGTPGTPGTPSDTFILEVFVGPFDDLDIRESSVSATTNHGTIVNTSTFRVYSTDAAHNPDPDGPGNTTLYGVTFSATDLRFGNHAIPAANIQFVPVTVDSIRPGDSVFVYARVTVPYGTHNGLYTGLATAYNNPATTSDTVRINVTVNAYYDLDIADNQQNLTSNKMTLAGPMGATRYGYFRMVNPNTPELNIDPDMYGNADFTSFTYTVDTLRYVPMGGEEILTYIPPSAVTLTLPSDGLVSGGMYDARVQVVIPMNTLTGTYRGQVTVTGNPSEPGTPTDHFILEVVVGALEDLDIAEASVSASGNQGAIVTTTNFTVWSTDAAEGHNPDSYDGPGNTTLYGINFIVSDLTLGNRTIPAANVQFVPPTIAELYPGTSATVRAIITIPYGTYNGTYTGLVTAQNNTGSVWDTVRIYLTVNSAYDLDIADNLQGLVENKMTLRLIPNLTQSSQFLLINPDRSENNYDPDPYGNADLTNLRYHVSEILYSHDGYTLDGSEIIFSNNPENLGWGQSVSVNVIATVKPTQHYATYYGTVTVSKPIGEIDSIYDSFTLEVVVGPREMFMMPDTIVVIGNAGEFADTVFYVKNIGNKTIDRIELFPMTDFYSAGGIRIPMKTIEFTPPIIVDSIKVGESTEVTLRVDIPRGMLPGHYIAKAKAMQQRGDPAFNFIILLNVRYRPDISEEIIFSDNPVTGSYVDIGVYGSEPRLTIMNMAAEIVLTVPTEEIKDGVYRWNLVNAKGKSVAPGLYVVILQSKIDEKDKVFTKKLLIVK